MLQSIVADSTIILFKLSTDPACLLQGLLTKVVFIMSLSGKCVCACSSVTHCITVIECMQAEEGNDVEGPN